MTDCTFSLKRFGLAMILLAAIPNSSVTGQRPTDYTPQGNGTIEPANPAPVGSEQNPAQVSGGVIAGSILHKQMPIYPKIAKEQHISGAVVVLVIIDPEGKVRKTKVISGPEALREAYLDAVRQWTYKPFLLNGRPVFIQTTITIHIQMGAD